MILFIAALFLLSTLVPYANADVLCLENGNSVEGIVKNESGEGVDLDIGSGVVKFEKAEIQNIERSSASENAALRKRWQEDKMRLSSKMIKEEEKKEKGEAKKGAKTKSEREGISPQQWGGITVAATLNERVDVSLLLDTGASLLILKKSLAKELGVDLAKDGQPVELVLADGRKSTGRYIILKSVTVGTIKAYDVEAAILNSDINEPTFGDGVLGMSFLKKFDFKVSPDENKLILENAR